MKHLQLVGNHAGNCFAASVLASLVAIEHHFDGEWPSSAYASHRAQKFFELAEDLADLNRGVDVKPLPEGKVRVSMVCVILGQHVR